MALSNSRQSCTFCAISTATLCMRPGSRLEMVSEGLLSAVLLFLTAHAKFMRASYFHSEHKIKYTVTRTKIDYFLFLVMAEQ